MNLILFLSSVSPVDVFTYSIQFRQNTNTQKVHVLHDPSHHQPAHKIQRSKIENERSDTWQKYSPMRTIFVLQCENVSFVSSGSNDTHMHVKGDHMLDIDEVFFFWFCVDSFVVAFCFQEIICKYTWELSSHRWRFHEKIKKLVKWTHRMHKIINVHSNDYLIYENAAIVYMNISVDVAFEI